MIDNVIIFINWPNYLVNRYNNIGINKCLKIKSSIKQLIAVYLFIKYKNGHLFGRKTIIFLYYL